MADTQEVLSKLKVPELKAKCKLLKIPNYSKLSKTESIARILAADSTQPLLTPPTVSAAAAATAAAPRQDEQGAGRKEDVNKTKERKGGNPKSTSSEGATSSNATLIPLPTQPSEARDPILRVPSSSAAVSQTGQYQASYPPLSTGKAKEDGKERKGPSAGTKRKVSGGEEGSLSRRTTGTNDNAPQASAPKMAKKVVKPVSKPAPTQHATPAPALPPAGLRPNPMPLVTARPTSTWTPIPSTGARTSISGLDPSIGTLPPSASGVKTSSILPLESKSEPKPKPEPKLKAGLTIPKPKANLPRPHFKPLIIVRPTPTPTPTPLAPPSQEAMIPLDSPADRLNYLEGHFLNTIFTHLHSNRIKPIIKPPFPHPSSFPTPSITSHLAFQGLHPCLYTSHTPEEFEVGLRFWVARLHTSFQLGSAEAWTARARGMEVMGPDMAGWPPVIGCRWVVGGIWVVKTLETGGEVDFLVVGCIGEVIGHSRDGKVGPKDPKEEGAGLAEVEGCKVRSDWAAYILNRAKVGLGSLVKSKDSYSFPGGISRTWRAGVGRSEAEVRIAERAVLASCALNSFSGEKLSAITMDAAWLGRLTTADNIIGKMGLGLDIYLPESSQVLSVHRPRDLHPALAIIHRVSGYSDYVLADTGQIVGTEDEGVVVLWQSLLGCNDKGVVDDSSMKEFWKGWESRMKAG